MALDTIGGKWKILIMEYLLEKEVLRYSAIKEMLPGITDKILIAALREMEEDGIVARKVFRVVPPKVEYSLTEQGFKYRPLITMMAELGELYRVKK